MSVGGQSSPSLSNLPTYNVVSIIAELARDTDGAENLLNQIYTLAGI